MTVTEYTSRTLAELVALIESDGLYVDAQCWLLDDDNSFSQDLTDDFIPSGSTVELDATRTIHRTCRIGLSRELVWGNARIQPALLLSTDGDDWTRFPLGVFLTTTPNHKITEATPTWDVQGYDLLELLSNPLGASITLAGGDTVLSTVEALVTGAGGTTGFDQTAAATTAAATTSWSFLEGSETTLTVCNAMLAQIGYEPIWVDRDGTFKSAPYKSPADRASVWSFNTSSSTTTVASERTATADMWRAANEILGINTSPELTTPVIGNGITVLTNDADGPTSVAARGRTIRKIMQGQYVSQAALETAVLQAMNIEKRVATKVQCRVSPNPTLSHNSVVSYRDDAIPVNGSHIVERWSLPLDGGDMTLDLRQV